MFSPKKIYEYYVNIKDVKLIVEKASRVLKKVIYNGHIKGFASTSDMDSPGTCITMANFDRLAII
jgi:hypothetical protein